MEHPHHRGVNHPHGRVASILGNTFLTGSVARGGLYAMNERLKHSNIRLTAISDIFSSPWAATGASRDRRSPELAGELTMAAEEANAPAGAPAGLPPLPHICGTGPTGHDAGLYSPPLVWSWGDPAPRVSSDRKAWVWSGHGGRGSHRPVYLTVGFKVEFTDSDTRFVAWTSCDDRRQGTSGQ